MCAPPSWNPPFGRTGWSGYRRIPEWVETWLSSEDLNVIEAFGRLCRNLGIEEGEGTPSFPERTVQIILANRSQLEALIEHSDAIAEFRAAREVATFFVEQENADQVQWVEDLLARTSVQRRDDVCVLVLDHGVNNGHRLLEPLLPDEDCHAANPEWGTHDHHGHGTRMAGTAAYGDLLRCIESKAPVIIATDWNRPRSCPRRQRRIPGTCGAISRLAASAGRRSNRRRSANGSSAWRSRAKRNCNGAGPLRGPGRSIAWPRGIWMIASGSSSSAPGTSATPRIGNDSRKRTSPAKFRIRPKPGTR